MMKNCGSCAEYANTPLHGIICRETGQPVGYLQVRPCWREKAAGADDNDKEETVQAPAKRRGGRKPKFPNRVDPETGAVLKHCAICGEYKPIDDFPTNRTHKDGHGSECKICHNKATVEAGRRRRAAKRAKLEEQQSADRAAAAPPDAARPLSSYTDKELADEIYRRGWEGTLTKSLKVG